MKRPSGWSLPAREKVAVTARSAAAAATGSVAKSATDWGSRPADTQAGAGAATGRQESIGADMPPATLPHRTRLAAFAIIGQ